ncbi:MAG: signal peptide peptidase SppA [Pasteurellales bacterium]|nr:MAG: signal peptide peptidase SppA [Pasteurellales bacterium]
MKILRFLFLLPWRLFKFIREIVLSLFCILLLIGGFAFYNVINPVDKSMQELNDFEKGALRIDLHGYLVDNVDPDDEFATEILSEITGNDTGYISMFDLVRTIRRAEKDNRITGIVLDFDHFTGGSLSHLEYLGSAIKDFKEKTGKKVIAISKYYTQSDYYLASYADRIFLNQAGEVDIHGLATNHLYYNDLFKNFDIEPKIYRVGTYKSAVEPFMLNKMSQDAKNNAQQWLNSVWNNYQNDVITNRKLSEKILLDEPKIYLDKFKKADKNFAKFAKNQGWITDITTEAKLLKTLQKEFGKDGKRYYSYIDYDIYKKLLSNRFEETDDDHIMVINVDGTLVDGSGQVDEVGDYDIVPLLKDARFDNNVKGVILRINSPGGSAFASDLIYQELLALKSIGKPVVTSMGEMAASGGYYIAAPSDKIIASKYTITGSIGVFGVGFNLEKTAQKYGVNADGVATHDFAKGSELNPIASEKDALMQASVEGVYDDFLTIVAQGRKLSKEAVDKIAQGQVWSGEDALKHKLVDKLGDFNTAYDEMMNVINDKRVKKGRDKIDNLPVVWVKEKKDFWEKLESSFGAKMQSLISYPFKNELSSLQKQAKQLDLLRDPKNIYLFCTACEYK